MTSRSRTTVDWEQVGRRLAATERALAEGAQDIGRHLKDLTRVPCTPPFVSGIIDAHGRILAAIDLKKLLALPESGISDQNTVIILRHADVEFGIFADRIVGTTRLRLSGLQPVPSGLVGAHAPCVRGVMPDGIVVLDGARLLAEKDLVVDDEVSP
jgi:purine-binding chemotaxis protein CheW